MSRPKIQIIGLHKIFNATSAHPTIVFENINLHIDDGEFICLVGPSGCGKSTTLLCIAGLEPPTSSQILLAGRRVLGPWTGFGRGVSRIRIILLAHRVEEYLIWA
jgi:ABC-type sugar transport system ATPase subunit